MNDTKTLNFGGIAYDLKDATLSKYLVEIEESGVFIVDENLNIGVDFSSILESANAYTRNQIDIFRGKDENKNYEYVGKRINLDNSYRFKFTKAFQLRTTLSNGRQGAAIYGDTLFQFYSGTYIVELYNLTNGTYTKSVNRDDKVSGTNHAGTATFGKQKYNQADLFPLLYVSDMGESNTQCSVYVYRVLTTSGATLLEPSSVTELTLVQTITFPAYPSSPYLPDAAVDAETNKLVVWGYSQQSRETSEVNSLENYIQIMVCDLPRFSDGDVTINASNYKCVHNFPFHWGVQDGCIRNGILYLVYGLYPDHEAGIMAIDYASGVLLTHIPLDVLGVRFEPEGFDIYDNSGVPEFIMTTYKGADGYLYRIEF